MLTALIAYLHYEAPVEEQNFATLLEMLNTMQVSEDDETYQNPVDPVSYTHLDVYKRQTPQSLPIWTPCQSLCAI